MILIMFKEYLMFISERVIIFSPKGDKLNNYSQLLAAYAVFITLKDKGNASNERNT